MFTKFTWLSEASMAKFRHRVQFAAALRRRANGTLAKDERGNVTIELAIVLPVALLILVGVFDLGYATFETMSLRSAARDQSSARFARMVEDVARQVEEGQSLSQAMATYPGTFDRIYTGLIQTAEVSGNLDTTFAQLAAYLERSEIIRAKVKAALRYPYFVFGTMIAVLALIAWIAASGK
jgi:Flp pilus assembly protein TadG